MQPVSQYTAQLSLPHNLQRASVIPFLTMQAVIRSLFYTRNGDEDDRGHKLIQNYCDT